MIRKLVATLLLIALPSLPALAGNGNSKGKGNGQGHAAIRTRGTGTRITATVVAAAAASRGATSTTTTITRRASPTTTATTGATTGTTSTSTATVRPASPRSTTAACRPGQAKKRYRVGYPLPRDIVILPVPVVLLPRLAPCPPGYRYGMIDGDLVKLAVGTMLVVDAIEGLTSR